MVLSDVTVLRPSFPLLDCKLAVSECSKLWVRRVRRCGRFLQCREEWLAELVAGLDDSNAYDYLKRLTDVHRLQLFDVVMQFRAIFADDSSSREDATASDGGAVYSWAEHRV